MAFRSLHCQDNITQDPRSIGLHQTLWVLGKIYGYRICFDDARTNILRNWIRRIGVNHDALDFLQNSYGIMTPDDVVLIKNYLCVCLDEIVGNPVKRLRSVDDDEIGKQFESGEIVKTVTNEERQ